MNWTPELVAKAHQHAAAHGLKFSSQMEGGTVVFARWEAPESAPTLEQLQAVVLIDPHALATARAQMAAILEALSVEDQALLWPSRVAIEQALDRGQITIAKKLVEIQALPPEKPYLLDAQAAILALFPNPEA